MTQVEKWPSRLKILKMEHTVLKYFCRSVPGRDTFSTWIVPTKKYVFWYFFGKKII